MARFKWLACQHWAQRSPAILCYVNKSYIINVNHSLSFPRPMFLVWEETREDRNKRLLNYAFDFPPAITADILSIGCYDRLSSRAWSLAPGDLGTPTSKRAKRAEFKEAHMPRGENWAFQVIWDPCVERVSESQTYASNKWLQAADHWWIFHWVGREHVDGGRIHLFAGLKFSDPLGEFLACTEYPGGRPHCPTAKPPCSAILPMKNVSKY